MPGLLLALTVLLTGGEALGPGRSPSAGPLGPGRSPSAGTLGPGRSPSAGPLGPGRSPSAGPLGPGRSPSAGPLSPPGFPDNSPVRWLLVQELVRTKRQLVTELVRTEPHLVHDMGRPEIHDSSSPQVQVESANSSQLKAPPPGGRQVDMTTGDEDEEDEMERMVHLAVLRDTDGYGGPADPSDPEMELRGGPGAVDASLETSGFYGTDLEDRDKGDEGGEDQGRRDGEEGWEREDRDRRGGREGGHTVFSSSEVKHTSPDLDTLIGYSSSLHPSSERSSSLPAELQDSGPQEQRASRVVEVGPPERHLWEAEEEAESSGYGLLHASITAAPGTPAGGITATVGPETDTGTDFGLLDGFTQGEVRDGQEGLVFTQNPTAPEMDLAPSRGPLQPSTEEDHLDQVQQDTRGSGLRVNQAEDEKWSTMETQESGMRRMILLTTDPPTTIDFTESELQPNLEEPQQVVCLNWSELAGRGYVILNMTQNMNCEEFRACQGVRLLKIIERVFARKMNSPEGSWVLYLSKPTHQQQQLLMNVASGRGVIETQDVLDMLGQIQKSLTKVGIQNYSAASSCQSRPSKTRSDYGKLFVVLVIIGSICMVIITSGVIYICWQRRLPNAKTMFRAEELHHVENGYHDNPTLDVTNDSQPEMQETKPSANGLTGAGGSTGGDGSRWQVFVNQAATEEDEEEQDTHL